MKASEDAEAKGQGGVAHQLHAREFLFYAYLQSGQDAKAKQEVADLDPVIAHLQTLPNIASDGMMVGAPEFQIEFPGIYNLELHQWKAALALPVPVAKNPRLAAFVEAYTDWIHVIAAGHLHDAGAASAASKDLDSVLATMRAHRVSPSQAAGMKTLEECVHAWNDFAAANNDETLRLIAMAADEQDKYGQNEVDIPIREMYADMLLELKRPADALVQYKTSLQNSPNRFNGLYNAGLAAEGAGKPAEARGFYTQLLAVTHNGASTKRPEIAHAQAYVKAPTPSRVAGEF